jgi:hypothetical protein
VGDCKNNMKTSKDHQQSSKKNKKKGGGLGFLSRKKKPDDYVEAPKKFADIIEEADKKIGELVIQKSVELDKEAGNEEYNRKALAVLKTIQYHIDEVIEQMADYADLKLKK